MVSFKSQPKFVHTDLIHSDLGMRTQKILAGVDTQKLYFFPRAPFLQSVTSPLIPLLFLDLSPNPNNKRTVFVLMCSAEVNALCCQKCSGLVGNWGYISRGLLRSFWWPQLCYSGCKRRPEQLVVIACSMSPIGNYCSRSLVSPTEKTSMKWHQWAQWFWSLSIDFRGNGNFFPTSAPQGCVWTQGR